MAWVGIVCLRLWVKLKKRFTENLTQSVKLSYFKTKIMKKMNFENLYTHADTPSLRQDKTRQGVASMVSCA